MSEFSVMKTFSSLSLQILLPKKRKKDRNKERKRQIVWVLVCFLPEDLSIVWPVSWFHVHSLWGSAASLSVLPASLPPFGFPYGMILCNQKHSIQKKLNEKIS